MTSSQFEDEFVADLGLRGKTAILTGASGNLGMVVAEALGGFGCELVLIDRSSKKFRDFHSSLLERNIKSDRYEVDFIDRTLRRITFEEIRVAYPVIDICINNAAYVGETEIQGWAEPFENQSVDVWRDALEVNLTSSFELIQCLTPALKNSAAGSVINIASIYGVVGPDWSLYEGTDMSNPAAYGASKAGLIQMAKWLSTSIGESVRANSISPGGIERRQPKAFRKSYESRVPMKRMAREQDIIGAIIFLASNMSLYVTGQNIVVDGGYTSW